MKIAVEHIRAIQSLGYTEEESRFLYIVATHSGYFVRRQILAFTGTSWCKWPHRFTSKLESRGHVTWREYQELGGVYHLCSRTLYRRIDRDNLCNRLRHATEFIRTRLLLLDFILANTAHNYFETEHAKVHFFCDELGIPKQALPAKTYKGFSPEPVLCYFVDKFPLFCDFPADSSSPVVTFSYVHPGLTSLVGFARHLNAYTPLFRHLAGFRFLYIAPCPVYFLRAEQCFRSLVCAPLEEEVPKDLARYFRLRAAWEAKQFGKVSSDEIEWLNQANQRFKGPGIERLYAAWVAGTVEQDEWRVLVKEALPPRNVEFRTCLVTAGRQLKP
jgi:hypothetical protein